MTLTELSITIWHDLAAPTLVGIATGLFLGWCIAGSNVKWARLAAAWQHAPETGRGRPLAFFCRFRSCNPRPGSRPSR
ncbi:Toxic polypeptide, small [Salmonella enterica subsp. enterica]|uniref:Toxic polypeptide, small n=1 Tax=Salmonella enterica I TaxID=59201 RepID=A0A379V2D7_SALET|nr:Toxic polypeptide, small [Salmonella enterica subsp. enterica]